MSRRDEDRKLARSGAFLGPFQMIPTPIRTLSDEYHDEPEPTDSDRVPDPEPPGRLRRLAIRLRSHRR
ncbi:MAG TPA: hypothetical protein VEY67_07870 [Candidatus Dormibacteraeota bacterium]|nr:hypothetical protein [Candidatus Dormibacteraeota bacterium]